MFDAYIKVGVSLLAVMSVIITVDKVVDIVMKFKGRAFMPLDDIKKDIIIMQAEIKDIKLKEVDYDKFLKSDNLRITELEKGLKMLLKTNQALIRHALNGNNVSQLEDIDSQLEKFIWR